MTLHESGEMYLESILVLQRGGERVRSVDLAEHMQFSKPSVSRAVGLLKNGGYITVDKDGTLFLTELGKEIAQKTYDRHQALTSLLMYMGVEEERACEDACKIEHDISDEASSAIMKFAEGKVPSMHHAHAHYHLKKK